MGVVEGWGSILNGRLQALGEHEVNVNGDFQSGHDYATQSMAGAFG